MSTVTAPDGHSAGAGSDPSMILPRRALSLDLPRGVDPVSSAAGVLSPEAEAAASTDLHQWELVWADHHGSGSGRLRRLAFSACIRGATYVRDMLAAALAASEDPDEEDEDDEGSGGQHHGASSPVSDAAEQDEDDEDSGEADTHVDLQPGPLPTLPPSGLPPGGVLTEHHVRCLTTAFPGRTRLARWDLVYSSRVDGCSLRSLMRAAAHRSPSLLAIKDTHGHVCGAFVCEPWKVAPRYYGTGESFVFTSSPLVTGGEIVTEPASAPGLVRIYKWSGRNAYFQLGHADALAVGGGKAYALKVDDDLAKGLSGDCDTFASPCLASAPEFEILHVDLWAFDTL